MENIAYFKLRFSVSETYWIILGTLRLNQNVLRVFKNTTSDINMTFNIITELSCKTEIKDVHF